jgi:putative transposase
MRYRRRHPDDGLQRERRRALAHERRRFGYRRLYVLLRREGYVVNRERVNRLYFNCTLGYWFLERVKGIEPSS